MSTLSSSGPPRVDEWPPRACVGKDTNLWFPAHGAEGAHLQRERAVRICRGCAARLACAEYALPIGDLAGIWGAMSAKERTTLRNKNKREA